MTSSDSNKRNDITWNYAIQGSSRSVIKCVFCEKTYHGGITRHKQHLIGEFKNVIQCPLCPPEVREEVKAFVDKKNVTRTQMNYEVSMNLIDEDGEMGPPPPKTHKISSNSSSGSSTTARTVTKGPLNLYFSAKQQEKGKGDSGSGLEAKKILRDRAVSAFAAWMYDAWLPFNCVNYKTFDKFIKAVGQYGPGMKPPSYHEDRVTHLKKEVKKIDQIIEEHKVEWNKFGCSIMMDKWTARNGKMIINVLVNSPRGSVFLESHDASNSSTDGSKMYSLFRKTIDKIGKENVVQIVTDNASENVSAGRMMEAMYPHIYWTPCAAHCINLMFGDIFKENPYASVFTKAVKVYSYLSQRPLLLNLMRKFTNERNLVRPAKTRFATAFLTLHSFYLQKKKLRKLVLSNEWKDNRYAKEAAGKETAKVLISPLFWNDVVWALKVGGPLIRVLCMVDGERKPPMGYLYEAIDRAKETIAVSFEGDVRKYEKVFDIIDSRWSNQLHRPLHAAGHLLNPGLFYKNTRDETLDSEVWIGYHECLEKLIPNSATVDQIGEEFGRYSQAEGLFGLQAAIRARDIRSPVEWWMQFRHQTPNLQKFAIKVLSLTCSASGCERN
nr:uncharacterized protein LOC104121638 [Nicotiana tomentosiformis]